MIGLTLKLGHSKMGHEEGLEKAGGGNLDKLIEAINISGTTIIIISKIDVIEKINIYKLFYNFNIINFDDFFQMKEFINNKLKEHCNFLDKIIYSNSVELTNLE